MPWQLLQHSSNSSIVLRALIAELDALSDALEGVSDLDVSKIIPIHVSHAPCQTNVGAAPSSLTRTEVTQSQNKNPPCRNFID